MQGPESSPKSECFSYTRWQSQTTNQADHIFATLSKSILWRLVFRSFQKDNFIGKLPGGSSKINRLSLNRCPPYTEIFSKRRKIYAVCVESLSMPVHWTKQWVVESCIQIKFVNALFASTKVWLGTKWIRGNKSSILWNVKSRFSSGRQTLKWCWPTPSVLTLEQLSVNRPGGRTVKRFLPAKPSTVETDTRGQVGVVRLGAYWQQEIELREFLGQI